MAAVILARSTSFIMSKSGLESMQPMNLLGIRFLLALGLLLIIFWKRVVKINRKTLRNGIIIGVIYTAVMASEMMGLKFTDSSKVAFLENTAIVFVPIFEMFLKRRLPDKLSGACSLMAIVGVGFLTLTEGLSGFSKGDGFSILAALLYTCGIIVTDRLTKNDDALLIGIVQVGTMGILSMIASFIIEAPVLPQSSTDWMLLLWLAIVCTCFGFTLQPLAQKYISSERSSTIAALNPLGAGILGVIVFNEKIGVSGVCGSLLVMAGVLLQSKKADIQD